MARPVRITDQSSPVPFLTEFLDYATIHGFKQLSHSPNSNAKKIFWIFVLLGSLAGGTYEIYRIVSYYSLKPSATQVSWTLQSEYEFPPMAFCPKRWMDIEKVENIGLNRDTLKYAISFLQQIDGVKIDEKNIMREIQGVMNRNGIRSYAHLIKKISYNSNGLIRIISTPTNLTLIPRIMENGVCYIIKVDPLKSSILRTNAMLKFAYHSPSNIEKYDRKQSKMLVNYGNGQNMNYIAFTKNGIYEIAFDAEVHHRMSRPGKLCSEDENRIYTNFDTCQNLCMTGEQIKRKCVLCVNVDMIEHLNLTMNDIQPCSNIQTPIQSESTPLDSCSGSELSMIADTCKSQCIPPCKQWIFKWSTVLISDAYLANEVVVWITYNPIDGILAFEEVPTYTWDTFLSNVGGQLALWLGISAISVIQIIYYFCLTCTRMIRGKRGIKELA